MPDNDYLQGSDFDTMLRAGGLLLLPRDRASAAMGHLVNHTECGGLGPVWVSPADGRVPDYLEHSEWPRDELSGPGLSRFTLRMPERIMVTLSLRPQAETLETARRQDAGAVLLDGLDTRHPFITALMAAAARRLIVVAAGGNRTGRLPASRLISPAGLYLSPERLDGCGTAVIGNLLARAAGPV